VADPGGKVVFLKDFDASARSLREFVLDKLG
jgi:hypothetical protein